MKELCDEIHAMGLKAGIYSTPWITSYAKFVGGSSDDPERRLVGEPGRRQVLAARQVPLCRQDARQWAAWGFDYLKYDWNPNDVPHAEEMSKALQAVRT